MPQGHLHFYPNQRFGEMPANMKFKEGRCRNTGVPQGHLHFYPNYKFGEMLAYFKPFRRRSSVFRQAENSRFSWGINIIPKNKLSDSWLHGAFISAVCRIKIKQIKAHYQSTEHLYTSFNKLINRYKYFTLFSTFCQHSYSPKYKGSTAQKPLGSYVHHLSVFHKIWDLDRNTNTLGVCL